jgi:hypothetical protein
MLTACLLASRLRVRHPALLAGAALGGLALHGSVVFWAFYLFHNDARYFAVALMVLEVGAIVGIVSQGWRREIAPLRPLAGSALATLVLTLFALSFGFVHGGTNDPLDAAASRFIPNLPPDNAVPHILARAVESDVRPLPDPLYVNWSPSDRPPLQTGIYLSTVSIGDENSSLQYSVVSALLQGLWVFGIWAFFAAARTERALATITTAAAFFSGFVLLNTLYVWPKLLSAAFLLVVAGVFLTSNGRTLLVERGCATVLGLNVGGALLAHTGAGIALLAIAATLLVLREVPSWRLVLPLVAIAAAMVAPWSVYQKVVDPPGDKLLKLQVAGIADIDTPRSLSHEILHHYRQIGIATAARNKLNNLAEPFRGSGAVLRETSRIAKSNAGVGDTNHAQRDQAILAFRVNQFFRVVPTLGLLALGPILFVLSLIASRLGLLRTRVRGGTRDDLSLALFLALTLLLWSLIMFGPNYTVIHQGPYLTPLLAFVLCTSLWWRVGRRATLAVVSLQAAVILYLYKDVPVGVRAGLFTAGNGLTPGGGALMLALTFVSLSAVVAILAAGLARPPDRIVGT